MNKKLEVGKIYIFKRNIFIITAIKETYYYAYGFFYHKNPKETSLQQIWFTSRAEENSIEI